MIPPALAVRSQSSNYRPEIDGLRAVAIIPVILNHFNKEWLPSGFLGVDVFFVISGLVISSSLLQQSLPGFRANILAFYSRRVKRLMPALYLLVIVGAILISLFNKYPGFSLQTGVTALFGVSNLYLFFQSTDYFSPSTELNIFTHTWSLGVEEQFYLLFPFLLWLAGPWRSKVGFTKKAISLLAFIILFLSVISLLLFVSFSSSRPAAAYFLMPSRFWEMGAGCLLALWSHDKKKQGQLGRPTFNKVIAWLSFAALLLVFKVFPEELSVFSTIATVGLTCALIATTPSGQTSRRNCLDSVTNLLCQPVLIAIGYLSYSLYLWHWPVFCISRWTIGTPLWSFPFLLGLIIAFSLISFLFVEQPLRKAVWAVANGATIMKGLLFALLSAGFLFVLGGPIKGRLFTGKGGAVMEPSRLASGLMEKEPLLNRKVESVLKECNATPFMLGVNSYSNNRPLDRNFIADCLERIGLPAARATPSGRSERPRLFLIGDSFAQKLAPFAALAAQKIGYDFHVFFGYGCPYLLRSDLIRHPSFPRCRYLSENMLEEVLLSSIKPGDILVLRIHASSKSYLRYSSASDQPAVESYDQAIEDLERKIKAKKASLLVLGGNPNLSTQEFAALRPEWFNVLNRSDTVNPRNSQETKFFHALDRHLDQRFAASAGSSYFSVSPFVCLDLERRKCLLSVGPKFLYEDDHHLSPFGHERFFSGFLDRLRQLAGLTNPLRS
jgi:peptidoglycan/LPS O-acetylase OafA/YrhL